MVEAALCGRSSTDWARKLHDVWHSRAAHGFIHRLMIWDDSLEIYIATSAFYPLIICCFVFFSSFRKHQNCVWEAKTTKKPDALCKEISVNRTTGLVKLNQMTWSPHRKERKTISSVQTLGGNQKEYLLASTFSCFSYVINILIQKCMSGPMGIRSVSKSVTFGSIWCWTRLFYIIYRFLNGGVLSWKPILCM